MKQNAYIALGLIFLLSCTNLNHSAKFSLDLTNESEVHIEGASCSLSDERGTIVWLEGAEWAWIKINRDLLKLSFKKIDMHDDDGTSYTIIFSNDDYTLTLDLKNTQVGGEETWLIEGIASIQKGEEIMNLKVSGGCAA